MKVEIIARTYENNNPEVEQDFSEFSYILGGRTGGTCYAKEGYFDKGIHDSARAMRIAKRTADSGHHSVFDHSSLTMTITGIPKFLAMVLNSTNCYATSEKSARYTFMTPDTKLEDSIYNKWLDTFKMLIVNKYGDLDIPVEKLAMENARYMISVFTPTSMCYTVSYRQLCYLTAWLNDFVKKASEYGAEFYKRAAVYAKELYDIFSTEIIDAEYNVEPNKRASFKFLATLNGKDVKDIRRVVGDVYSIKYRASLACLAQLQRHKSLNYEMFFKDEEDYWWYIPEIIRGTSYEDQWVNDLETLKSAGIYPQALTVNVCETGTVEDFLMKAQERLCARAQLEIMDNVIESIGVLKYDQTYSQMSEYSNALLDKWFDKYGEVKLKCQVMKCLEPCVWGGKNGKTRLI